MTDITEAVQSLSGSSALITMYQLDAISLGDDQIRCFTQTSKADSSSIVFNSITYTPIDIEANGFEWGGTGAPPTPTIRIANTSLLIGALARDFGDLIGAQLRRIRTFRKFLDDGTAPDPAMKFPEDVFRIERKSAHNKVFLEWELAVPFDQEGRSIPGRICLRDACTHTYRYWNGSAFVYTKATCPYVGTAYFDRTGAVTTQALDRCGKRLSDCEKRFGSAAFPTRAFPGMSRFSL